MVSLKVKLSLIAVCFGLLILVGVASALTHVTVLRPGSHFFTCDSSYPMAYVSPDGVVEVVCTPTK